MIRVTGGSLRGHRLRTPPERITRPPTGRVRQAVFNILGQSVHGACVLDLFAGSGSYSIESLSRGAKKATLVEIHPAARRMIRNNLASTGLEDSCQIIAGDVLRIIPTLRERFSFIIVAPPHFLDLIDPTLQALSNADILAEGCQVMVQHHKSEIPRANTGALARFRQNHYGTTTLSWYAKQTAFPSPS